MKQRIITGIIGGVAFISLLVLGGWWFALLVAALAFVAYDELLRMAKINRWSAPAVVGAIALLLLFISFLQKLQFINVGPFALSLETLFIAYVLILLFIIVASKNKFTIEQVGPLFIAVFYIGLGFVYFLETRIVEGVAFVFFVLLVIWATDTGAYFIGSKYGRRKLWPSISPNKSFEGFIGGIATSIVIGFIVNYFFVLFHNLWYMILLIILISIAGQIGDFIESAIKRFYQVKDSGTVLPGHGGVFDRFDSLIFVFPLLHLLQLI